MRVTVSNPRGYKNGTNQKNALGTSTIFFEERKIKKMQVFSPKAFAYLEK